MKLMVLCAGNPYYAHQATQKTQWERPAAEPVPQPEAQPQPSQTSKAEPEAAPEPPAPTKSAAAAKPARRVSTDQVASH